MLSSRSLRIPTNRYPWLPHDMYYRMDIVLPDSSLQPKGEVGMVQYPNLRRSQARAPCARVGGSGLNYPRGTRNHGEGCGPRARYLAFSEQYSKECSDRNPPRGFEVNL